jgi:hypothetical protein
MRAFWSIALYVSHRPTASFPAKHSNPRRTPRVHKTPGQWQDSKYLQTTVSFPPFRPRSFKPRIPPLVPFPPVHFLHSLLATAPRKKKKEFAVQKFSVGSEFSIQSARRRIGCGKRRPPPPYPVRHSLAASFFPCCFSVAVAGGSLLQL